MNYYQEASSKLQASELKLRSGNSDELTKYISGVVRSLTHINEDIQRLLVSEFVGTGALKELLENTAISEIMINRYDQIYVEQDGKIQKVDHRFSCEEALRQIVMRLLSPLGKRIDEAQPMVDARLPDGSRLNAIMKPLCLEGMCVTIRKFMKSMLTPDALVEVGALTNESLGFLRDCVEKRRNILIAGGTGTGKTTFLNALSGFIDAQQRLITIEDAAELQLLQPHVIRLETRTANSEGAGAISMRSLLKNALRMRPDRIIIGECRGEETIDMLNAMNTGHEGSMTTVHANTTRDALTRLENLVLLSGMELPLKALRDQISSAIHIVVTLIRTSSGKRKVSAISEVCGSSEGIIALKEIYKLDAQEKLQPCSHWASALGMKPGPSAIHGLGL